MELTANQIERLIEIIQQYEVIYGGGISSKDARVREECDSLIRILEKLKKSAQGKKTSGARTETAAVAKAAKEKKDSASAKTKKARKARSVTSPPNTSAATASAPEESKEEEIPELTRIKPTIERHRKKKIQAIQLFTAYERGRLPKYGGYIVSSNFQPESKYSIFEIAGYDNVQEIRLEGNTLVFKSAGCKLYTLIEPANYHLKNVEPVQRESGKSIPYRFSELFTLTTKKHETIYIGKKPIVTYSSFTIVKPEKNDFAILFYNVPDVFENIQDFLASVFYQGAGIPKRDASKAAKITVQGIKNFNTWLDL